MKHTDILIIDDEVKFADMLAKRLTLRKLKCAVCYDGLSGVEWIKTRSGSLSLILLDLRLPDIYGIQVMTEIKKINPDIPIVIVTGHGTEADRTECMRLGAFDFTNKPIHIETIVSLLSRIKGA